MSLRRDDQGRYGHVPPVQYPTPDQQYAPTRRLSFSNGDDAGGYLGRPPPMAPPPHPQAQMVNAQGFQANSGSGADELFLPSDSPSRTSYSSMNSAPNYAHQSQYQGEPSPNSQALYNPQHFSRTPSTSLPYHPHPSSTPLAAPRYSIAAAPALASPTQTSFTPQAYNPAAYASATMPQRQPTYQGHNNYSGGYGSQYGQHGGANGLQSPMSPGYGPQSPAYSSSSSHYQPPQQQMYAQQPSPGYGAIDSSATHTPVSYETPYSRPHSNSLSQSGYAVTPYGAQTNGGSPVPPGGYGNSASPQPPYPLTSQMPVGPQYDADLSYFNRVGRSGSLSSTTSSSGHPTTGLQRHPTNAPLPNRPMDDVPEESAWDMNGGRAEYDDDYDHHAQERMMHDIETELSQPPSRQQHHYYDQQTSSQYSDDDAGSLERYDSNTTTGISRNPSSAASVSVAQSGRSYMQPLPSYDEEDDDPEGQAGVLAMQQAEMDERRFSGSAFGQNDTPTSTHPPQPPPLPPKECSSSGDSDFGGLPVMDLGLMGGGYAGNLAYGDEPLSPQHSGDDQSGALVRADYQYADSQDARTYDADHDYIGTGGLQLPTAHRLSFDEGDDRDSPRRSGSVSPAKQEYEDLFYHPGIGNRPLPAIPPVPNERPTLPPVQIPSHAQQQQYYQHEQHPTGPDGHPVHAPGSIYSPVTPQHVERSISLTSHTNTPQVQTPARSRTDAADERRRHTKMIPALPGQSEGYEPPAGGSMDFGMIALPSGRKRKFIPSKLTQADLDCCAEPWALSGLAGWVREMTEGDFYLKAKDIEEGFIRLFTAKVPTMHVADAETLSARVIALMVDSGILVKDEEWVKLCTGTITGVLWQLTGRGCYASKLHNFNIPGRCYSYHCGRTLKKASLDHLIFEVPKQEDWATFYKITKDTIEGKPKKEVERQNNLHEIVTGEERYLNELEVLRVLYRDQLRAIQPAIIPPKNLGSFINSVFGKVDAVQTVNKDHLLAQLKYRQQEQGPWVGGFSDLLREWIRKARTPYLEFASSYPYAVFLIRREADRNVLFAQFLDEVRSHRLSMRLDWTNFIKAPITRLQRYSFLLESMLKNSAPDSDETANLEMAIKEIKAVTLEADAKVDEKTRAVQMMELNDMIVMRPGSNPSLHLDHLGRELILQGDLIRMGSKGVRWVETHALLFDHYLILAKVVGAKDGRGDKKYDVSKEPVPMRLLFLESNNDDPVPKQKSITAPLSRGTAAAASDTKLNKMTTNGSERPGLDHTATNSSMGSVARLTPGSADPTNLLYPFRIKHLGHEVYTLYASSSQSRHEWCAAITAAKERHVAALWSQRAEPFKLRVLADCSFAYDSMTPVVRSTVGPIRGTPLDRAIKDIEDVYRGGVKPPPVSRAAVNCATAFSAYGKHIIAIGTDYGVFISSTSDPRGWMRTVQSPKVSQIAVLEEFSVCLIISDKSLISFPLDVVAPVSSYPGPGNDSARRNPTRLAKDVAYFAIARMKERMLLCYKRRENLHSMFKVLEPVFQKTTEKRSRLFGRKSGVGTTESFRDFDEFFFPTECYSLSIFQTYISVGTAKGFEMLTLDKKQPMSIPDLKDPAIANVAMRIRDLRPLGMFKLNEQEYILAYDECAVYVDRHGDVSRTLIMEYSGKQRKARGATMHHPYLILYNEDYVEVRNAENGRLKQIIAGKDVRILDFGDKGPTGPGGGPQSSTAHHGVLPNPSRSTVKISMGHPENPGMQIILELMLNEGHLIDGN